MRATIGWSYDLLDEREQRLFETLAVFVGGCTLDALEAVADPDEALLETLSSLVDKSLLREVGETEPRFAMLETVRDFALERLAESGHEEELRARHARHYLDVAEAADADIRGAGGRAAFETFELEQ